MSVKVGTVEGWIQSLDPSKSSLEYEAEKGMVKLLRCKLCVKPPPVSCFKCDSGKILFDYEKSQDRLAGKSERANT